jgi:hypothetical protein
MSFFEPPPPPGPVTRAMVVSARPWLGPPLNALPGIAPGVQFADDRKATNLDRPAHDPDHEPDHPVLHPHGGGGGGSAWDMEHWVWPLPPTGPFTFVYEWPARAIAESRAEIDAGSILEAAGRAVTLWPDE